MSLMEEITSPKKVFPRNSDPTRRGHGSSERVTLSLEATPAGFRSSSKDIDMGPEKRLLKQRTSLRNSRLRNSEIATAKHRASKFVSSAAIAHVKFEPVSILEMAFDAVEAEDDGQLEALLEEGGDSALKHLAAEDDRGETLMSCAARLNRPSTVRILAKKLPALIQRKEKTWGWTPVHYAAGAGSTLALLELIRQNASPNVAGMDGLPIHIAVAESQLTICEMLVQAKADVDAQDELGQTPLHIAAQCGDASTLKRLLELGGDAFYRDHSQRVPDEHPALFGVAEEEAKEVRRALVGCCVCHRVIEEPMLCSVCSARRYCSSACQKTDWFKLSHCARCETMRVRMEPTKAMRALLERGGMSS